MEVDSDISNDEYLGCDDDAVIVLPADEIEESGENEYMDCYNSDERDVPLFEVADESSGSLLETELPVCCIDVDPTRGNCVLFGGCDDKAYISNLPSNAAGRCEKINVGYKHMLEGHTDTVSCVSYSKDGKYFATGGCEGAIRVYCNDDHNYCSLLKVLEGPSNELEYLTWHPKGPCILAGGLDTTSWLWLLPEGRVLSVLSGHSDSVTCGDFTNDGKLVCTGSIDGSLIIWNPKNGESIYKISKKNFIESNNMNGETVMDDNPGVVSLKCHRVNPILAVGLTNGLFSLVHTETGKILNANVKHSDSLSCLEFSHIINDPLVATGDISGKLIIWNYEYNRINFEIDHQELEHSNGVSPGITNICWGGGRDGSTLITTGCLDGTIRVWDYRNGENVKILKGHRSGILSLKVIESYGNNVNDNTNNDHILRIVSAGDDGRCLLWDIRK